MKIVIVRDITPYAGAIYGRYKTILVLQYSLKFNVCKVSVILPINYTWRDLILLKDFNWQ